jgi:Ca2+-binding RTX toxin-like protein
VTVNNRNEAPDIVSNGGSINANVAVSENATAVTTLVAIDPEGGVTYSLAGHDAALFTLDAVTGVLSFAAAPDFEAPGDAGGDNRCDLMVTASDGNFSAFQYIYVHVGDVNEGVTITSPASSSVLENGTAVATVTASDLDGDAVTFSITGGADAALFALDAETGVLSFLAAPDYETPGDADGDNVFDVVVSASDGSLADTQALSIVLGDVDEAPAIVTPSAWTATENATAVGVLEAADPEESWLTYRIVGGADAARFALDSASGALAFRQAPNFEAPGDADGDNVYDLIVEASDAAHAVTQALAVTVGNVNEAPVITSGGGGASAAYGVSENALAVAAIAAGDPEGGVTYALAGGADAARFAIDAGTGVLTFLTAPDYDAPADSNGDNLYEVVVRASDGSLADSQALTVAVGNLVDGLSRTGTSRADTLSGSYEEDVLSGLAGNDTLSGFGGADTIDGGDGRDRICGGTGTDVLTGGLKADTFEFDALNESTVGLSDRIVDFSRSQGDKISLSDIDANALVASNQAFSFIGTGAFSNQAGQLRYFQQNGDTFVAGDVNGDGAADFQIVVDPLVSFIASDFLL